MAEEKYVHLNDGQEVEEDDLNLMAASALMDDRVLADLLRLAPYDGSTVAKAIIPFTTKGSLGGVPAGFLSTVRPSLLAEGSVYVMPFRAVVGSRTAVSGSALDNWRDIRSGVFAQSSDATNLGYRVALAANGSGNSRWDLVYASLAVDANGSTVNRYTKSPSTGAITPSSIAKSIVQSIAIGVVTGTPGASPAYPTLPSDAGGTYYIPLAYVRVPNGFSGISTVDGRNIYEIAPCAQLARALGAARCAPADSTNAVGGATQTNFPWNGTNLERPSMYFPPSMAGMESVFFPMDFATGGAFSHPNGAVIDGSRDWRNRMFRVFVMCAASGAGTSMFTWDKTAGSAAMPTPAQDSSTYRKNVVWTFGQSFTIDGTGVGGAGATVFDSGGSFGSVIANTTSFGVYVDMSTGQLKSFVSGVPAVRALVWLDATGMFAGW